MTAKSPPINRWPGETELVPESWNRKCDVSTLAASYRLFAEVPVPSGTGTSACLNHLPSQGGESCTRPVEAQIPPLPTPAGNPRHFAGQFP